jgi:phospholipid transport system transporter-binding protein
MGSKSRGDAAAVKGAVVIGLPTDCRIAELTALKEQLRAALDAPSSTLDATGVDRIDTAALQLLLAFSRDAQARGGKVAWNGVGTTLYDAAQLLGLAQTLALPATQPA